MRKRQWVYTLFGGMSCSYLNVISPRYGWLSGWYIRARESFDWIQTTLSPVARPSLIPAIQLFLTLLHRSLRQLTLWALLSSLLTSRGYWSFFFFIEYFRFSFFTFNAACPGCYRGAALCCWCSALAAVTVVAEAPSDNASGILPSIQSDSLVTRNLLIL